MRTAFAAIALAAAVTITGCSGSRGSSSPPQTDVAATHAASLRFAGVAAVLPADHADQGLATINGHLLTRGHGDFTITFVHEGYLHIGDPDARNGYVLDAFEKNSGNVKLFRWTAPNGASVNWTHTDIPGEAHNNSFAAITPDGRWFVSGEWGTERRLLVFAFPSGFRSQALPLAGTISLSAPLVNVQGCDFGSPTVLYCTAAPAELVKVTLAHPLNGSPDTASAAVVTRLPAEGDCVGGEFEAEGVDVTGGIATVSVNTPAACSPQTFLYRYDLP